jgi:hypothetical protein
MATLISPTILGITAFVVIVTSAQGQTSRYSKQLQRACANDYKAFCG